MKNIELEIATDFCGESEKLEAIEQTLRQISEAGFTHIHWCHEWSGDYLYSVYEMEQIREWMDRYNLRAKSLHATCGSLSDDATHFRKDYTSEWEWNRKAGVELIKNRVDLAKSLGASEIVLHLYVPYEAIRAGRMTKDRFYGQVGKSMDELQPYCLERGVRICLESLFDVPKEDMLEQWDWVRNNYPKEFLGFCVDTGHMNMVWHSGLTDVMRTYKDRIFAVHLHDNDGVDDLHMIPGEGNIDWKETMAALAESVYQLPLTLEISCRQDDAGTFLQNAYEAGIWLDRLYHEAAEKQLVK